MAFGLALVLLVLLVLVVPLARFAEVDARFAAGRVAVCSEPCAGARRASPVGSPADAEAASSPGVESVAGLPAAAAGCVIANWAIWLNWDCSRFHHADASNGGVAGACSSSPDGSSADDPALAEAAAAGVGAAGCGQPVAGAGLGAADAAVGCAIDDCAKAPNARNVARVARCTSSA